MKKLTVVSSLIALSLQSSITLAQEDFRQYSNRELFQEMHQHTQQMDRQDLAAYRAEMQWRARRMSSDEMRAYGVGINRSGELYFQDRNRTQKMAQQQLRQKDMSGTPDRDRTREQDKTHAQDMDKNQECDPVGSGGAGSGGNGDGNGDGNGGGNGGGGGSGGGGGGGSGGGGGGGSGGGGGGGGGGRG